MQNCETYTEQEDQSNHHHRNKQYPLVEALLPVNNMVQAVLVCRGDLLGRLIGLASKRYCRCQAQPSQKVAQVLLQSFHLVTAWSSPAQRLRPPEGTLPRYSVSK